MFHLHCNLSTLQHDTECRHLYSYLKPESARVHPEATVRPWATVQVEGDAIGFAAALGYECICPSTDLTHRSKRTSFLIYRRRSQIYKRGYCFRKGPLIILMFQQEQVRQSHVSTPRNKLTSPRWTRKPNNLSRLMRTPFGRSKSRPQNLFATRQRHPSVER